MFGLRYLPGVVTLTLSGEKCNGCGMCQSVCPHAVFQVEAGKARIADRDACMECGACALNCPTEALSVQSGVGCAAAVILGALKRTVASCDCSGGPTCGCG